RLDPRRPAVAAGTREMESELLHVPRPRGATLGAQAAVQAHVFVLHHDAAGLQPVRHVERLVRMPRRRAEARAQVDLDAVLREGDAVDGADVDARIALDALAGGEQ